MGAPGAGANRSATILERPPEPVAVYQYPSLVKNPVKKERRPRFNPRQTGDIHMAPDEALEIDRQADRGERTIVGEGDEQVKIGGLVLIPSRKRPIENCQADAAIGAQCPPELGEKLPVVAQVVMLDRVKTEPAGAEATAPNRPLRDGATQRALVSAQVCRQLLDRSHKRESSECMSDRRLNYVTKTL